MKALRQKPGVLSSELSGFSRDLDEVGRSVVPTHRVSSGRFLASRRTIALETADRLAAVLKLRLIAEQ
jgi:hypothetical protein